MAGGEAERTVVIPQPGGPIHFVLRVGDCFWGKEKTMVADFKWRMGFCKNVYMGSLFRDGERRGNLGVSDPGGQVENDKAPDQRRVIPNPIRTSELI